MNRFAFGAGAIRALSGASFIIAPNTAQRMWSTREASDPTAQLLLRSMGYRDLVIGAGMMRAAMGHGDVAGWFLVSAGADAADLLGGLTVKDQLSERDHVTGIGGAAAGIAVGVIGALAARRSSAAG